MSADVEMGSAKGCRNSKQRMMAYDNKLCVITQGLRMLLLLYAIIPCLGHTYILHLVPTLPSLYPPTF